MYLLALVCFYVQLEQKADFSDIELEFLIRGTLLTVQRICFNFFLIFFKGNSDTNINITLADFGVSKDKNHLAWIPKDNYSDLLALSLLQGDMDHFILAVVSDENEWKKWYQDPLKQLMPKIEMEVENNDSN